MKYSWLVEQKHPKDYTGTSLKWKQKMGFTISFKVYITWMKFKNAIPHNDHEVFIFNQNKNRAC